MARYMVLGGSGLVGTALIKHLVERGDRVSLVSRKPLAVSAELQRLTEVLPLLQSAWVNAAKEEPFAGVVNLAGQSIFNGRWTEDSKKAILQSRLDVTNAVVKWIENESNPPAVLVNASAVGYYGCSESKAFTENDLMWKEDFLAYVANEWERAAQLAQNSGVRIVRARLGIVFAKQGGALPRIVAPYRMHVGGTIGSGRQWVSWIHIRDVIRLLTLGLDDPFVTGPLNITAPNPVTMAELGKAIALRLNTHQLFPVPGAVIRTVLGEAADLILKGQKVLPKKAEDLGYQFLYKTVQEALVDLL